MENNMETTQGDHPQVPPAKPPDQGDGQPNEEVPVNGAHVLNEAMSEDSSEDETPTAAAKNGVSLPVKPASDSGGDHMGTPGGAHCSETRQNVQKEPKIQRHGFDWK